MCDIDVRSFDRHMLWTYCKSYPTAHLRRRLTSRNQNKCRRNQPRNRSTSVIEERMW